MSAIGTAWQLWVDTGGTFTDCWARSPEGALRRFKVLSDGSLRGRLRPGERSSEVVFELGIELPEGFLEGLELTTLGEPAERVVIRESRADGRLRLDRLLAVAVPVRAEVRLAEEVPVAAARIATGCRPGEELPPLEMRLATTRATNALLERAGARTALVVTRGFADLLAIGNQQRPDLFALAIERPEPFYAEVVEVDERIDARGAVVRPLETGEVEETVRQLVARGYRTAAVVLLNSYLCADHEIELERLLKTAGFTHVTRSSEVAPFVGAVKRGETAVVDAYLAPDLTRYVEAVGAALASEALHMMTSAGGLQRPARIRPKDCLLSGPAGGIVGAVRAAAEVGVERVISFDMGGTSTDVARYDGEYDYRFETELGGARVLAPSLAIETVAAGGGSICWFDGRRLRVGPASAGARPGPACYGAGGPLTLTDVDVLLGRLGRDRFEVPLVLEAAAASRDALLEAVRGIDPDVDSDELLAGLLRIADERMAEAIRRISVRHGYDPRSYLLVAFGGAGGQHACAVAELLGIERILLPKDASLLSAWGLGHAVVERFAERQVLQPMDDFEPRAAELLGELEREARRRVSADGVPEEEIGVRRRLLMLRLEGQDSTLTVDFEAGRGVGELFEEAYAEQYGYAPPERPVEVESVRVVVSNRPPDPPSLGPVTARPPAPATSQRAFVGDGWGDTPVYERDDLEPGAGLVGPALVVERFSSLVVTAGWSCRVAAGGGLMVEREETGRRESGRSEIGRVGSAREEVGRGE